VTFRALPPVQPPGTKGAAAPPPDFLVGLDLGRVKDFTALAVLERWRPAGADGRGARHYACRHLHRFPLNTPYTGAGGEAGVAEGVAGLLGRLPGRAALVVDQTGVGRAVVDVLRKARLPVSQLAAVTITAGHGPPNRPEGGGGWNVAKRHLASTLLAVTGTRRLRGAPALPLAATLTRELEAFSLKVSPDTGNETFESWRERDHDDLVLALALACWWGEFGSRRVLFAV
jgi:hypothetical protein